MVMAAARCHVAKGRGTCVAVTSWPHSFSHQWETSSFSQSHLEISQLVSGLQRSKNTHLPSLILGNRISSLVLCFVNTIGSFCDWEAREESRSALLWSGRVDSGQPVLLHCLYDMILKVMHWNPCETLIVELVFMVESRYTIINQGCVLACLSARLT